MLDVIQSRVLIAISFHFRESRLKYLSQIINEFLSYSVQKVDIYILSNTKSADERISIEHAYKYHLKNWDKKLGNRNIHVEYWTDLLDPWMLTWCHKHLIKDLFAVDRSQYDYFIYVEDDILVPYNGFTYFVKSLEKTKPQGFIPGFQRVEYSKEKNQLCMLDTRQKFMLDKNFFVLDNVEFISPSFPYAAMFILDRELGFEYITSKSFTEEQSRTLAKNWGIPERSAMGLGLENRPGRFKSRYLVPIERAYRSVMPSAFVYHVPNNYCDNPATEFGKIPVTDYLIDFQSRAVQKRRMIKRRQRRVAMRGPGVET